MLLEKYKDSFLLERESSGYILVIFQPILFNLKLKNVLLEKNILVSAKSVPAV